MSWKGLSKEGSSIIFNLLYENRLSFDFRNCPDTIFIKTKDKNYIILPLDEIYHRENQLDYIPVKYRIKINNECIQKSIGCLNFNTLKICGMSFKDFLEEYNI